jgi:PAS domain S-box-containing protein
MKVGTRSRGDTDEHIRLVADSLPLLVWMSGPDKGGTYFNKGWLDFTGRPLESEIGDGWADGVLADDRQACLDTYTRAFDHREPFLMEYRLRRHDGEYRWVLDNAAPRFDAAGSFAGYIGACFDVTALRLGEAERKAAEESLRRKEMELNEAQRLAGVGSWQWERQTDTVVWSEELYHLAGRDPRLPAVSYKDHGQLYSPDSWQRLQRAVETALTTGAPYELVMEMICADGRRRWVTARGEVQRDSAGHVMGLRGTVQDITERKLAEEALSSVNGRLIEAQESERARIARDLHDDIGQRLAMLTTALEQVKRLEPVLSDEVLRRLVALQQQTAEITAGVQAMSHALHPPRLLHLGVVAAMRGFCQELAAQENVGIDFVHEQVPENVPPDVSLCLFRVLQEALHNGVRHSQARHFAVHLRGTGAAVQLNVRDEGVGFDVDAASRALGLGLTSMKERLKLVGGELVIESQTTRGTTVLARAPLQQGEGATALS